MKEKLRNNLIIVLSIFIVFGCWEIFSYVSDSPLVFPHLKTVIKEFSRLVVEKQFWISLSSSVLRVLEAFILTLFLGTILGLASGFWNCVKSFLFFPLSIIRTTPVVAVIMIMLFWFDSKTLPVICAVLMGLPLMTDSVCKAVRQTDKKLLEMAYVFKLSSFTKLSCVYIPCIKPYFVGAAHTVFSQGWKVVAAGEILALPRNAF